MYRHRRSRIGKTPLSSSSAAVGVPYDAPKIFLSTPCSNDSSRRIPLSESRSHHTSAPYVTVGTIIVLYSLTRVLMLRCLFVRMCIHLAAAFCAFSRTWTACASYVPDADMNTPRHRTAAAGFTSCPSRNMLPTRRSFGTTANNSHLDGFGRRFDRLL